MHSFNNASNFVVHTLNQTENRTVDVDGFKLLQDHMVMGATHNSGERFDAPKCHPETRKAVLNSIRTWVDSNNARLMWLHGPAGAGKSAIAQTTAVDCYKDRMLGATFFFSRLAGRKKKVGLVATLAYQLCVALPGTKDRIIESIAKNPKIFESNIQTQFESLIIEPLNLAYQAGGEPVSPKLIIIDGLDECDNGKDQVEIIEAVTHALSMEHGFRLCVLLVSRPELEIRQAFNSDDISPFCTRLALDDTFNPDKDIELYLRTSFQTIKHRHTLGSTLSESWPSDDAISQIVEKSSGQFIYASTVINFVSDPKRDPRKRLDTVLKIKPENGEKPFAQLDALYHSILSMCEEYKDVAFILEAIMFLNREHTPVDGIEILKSTQYLNAFLSLEDDVLLYLANLHSIVDVDNIDDTGIRFYHASFYDFLVDSSRSKEYYIDQHKAHARLSLRCFDFLESNVTLGTPNIVYAYCFGCFFCHYRLSNWDDSVSKFICEKDVLKPGNNQMTAIFQTFYAQPYTGMPVERTDCTSMLGKLIHRVQYKQGDGYDKVKANVQDIIDKETFNHLSQYAQWHDDILVLYAGIVSFDADSSDKSTITPPCAINFDLHKDFKTAVERGNNNILNHDIMYNYLVNRWFRKLMETTYINQLPEDIQAKSISRMLEFIANRLEGNLNIAMTEFIVHVDKVFSDIAENINMRSAIVPDGPATRLLLNKWKIVNDNYELEEGIGLMKLLRKFGKGSNMGMDREVVSSGDAAEIILPCNTTEVEGDHSGLESITQPNNPQHIRISENDDSRKLTNILTHDDGGMGTGDIITKVDDIEESNSLPKTVQVNKNGYVLD